MKLINVFGIVFVSLLLSACKVELVVEDEEEQEDVIHITVDRDYPSNTVDSSQEYDLHLVDSERIMTVKGNLRKLIITGDRNITYVITDREIELLSISGFGNQLFEEQVSINLNRIELSGSNNTITVSKCRSLMDTGESNLLILMEGEGCEEY